VLNSFLQFLEQDDSQGLIIAATNHAELLDKALFRRFDDVIEYGLPDVALINRIFKNRLAAFDTKALVWDELSEAAMGLSPAEIVRAAENAAKSVLLAGGKSIVSSELVASIVERRKASFLNAT
jgi:SpoVK/Ycf46/Vps4 family AAA+-type ATPase